MQRRNRNMHGAPFEVEGFGVDAAIPETESRRKAHVAGAAVDAGYEGGDETRELDECACVWELTDRVSVVSAREGGTEKAGGRVWR